MRFNTLTLFYSDAGRIKEYFDIDLDPDLSAPEYIVLFIAVPDNFTFKTVMDGIDRAVVYGTRQNCLSRARHAPSSARQCKIQR